MERWILNCPLGEALKMSGQIDILCPQRMAARRDIQANEIYKPSKNFGKWKELTGVQPLSNEGDEMIFRPDEDTDDNPND